MYLVEVIPIARSARKDSLTYLSKEKVSPGHIVEAPLRKQAISALVLTCSEAKNVKSAIRHSDFQLRKIKKTKNNNVLTKEFISAVSKTSEHFATYIGQVFFSLTPNNKIGRAHV